MTERRSTLFTLLVHNSLQFHSASRSERDAARILAREVDEKPPEDERHLVERTHLPSPAETGLEQIGW